MGIQIPADYRPSETEPFMNERQREYFRRKLNGWKEEILKESRETIQNLQAETVPHADLADRASTEAERQLELRTRDRQRKLIAKIEPRCAGSKTALTVSARRPANRSPSSGWMPGRSPRCRSRRRSAMSGARKSIATINGAVLPEASIDGPFRQFWKAFHRAQNYKAAHRFVLGEIRAQCVPAANGNRAAWRSALGNAYLSFL